jgi:casein kinase II subunit beta
MLKMETANNSKSADLGSRKDTEGESCKDVKKKERNTSTSGWITKFRKRHGNEWLEEIDRDFLRDSSNFTGLDEEICHLSHGLHIMMSDGLYLDSNGNGKIRTKTEGKHLEAAEMLFCLIHARYLLTNKGLEKVLKKYKEGFYGSCPRYYCLKTKVLPIGVSDRLGDSDVKTYCPSCEDLYHAESGHELADGACFGTNLPQMFFMAYPALHPSPTLGHYEPRAFGFKIRHPPETEHSEITEFKTRQKCTTKHYRLKSNGKDRIKHSCKENDQDNTKDKLPDINGHSRTESTKDINEHSAEKTQRKRRRRKRTTEMTEQ